MSFVQESDVFIRQILISKDGARVTNRVQMRETRNKAHRETSYFIASNILYLDNNYYVENHSRLIMSPLCTQRWGHVALPLSAQCCLWRSVSLCVPFIYVQRHTECGPAAQTAGQH